MRRRATALMLVLIVTACQGADTTQSSPATLPTAAGTTTNVVTATTALATGVKTLDLLIDEWAAVNDPVGVAAAALYPDGTLWLGASGMEDRDNGIEVDPSDRFEIASITKTFMSVLALRLIEEGIVGLDDPVSTYLPDVPEAENMTIRMLLGHRAGVYDPTSELVSDRDGPPDPDRVFTPEEIIQAAAAGSPSFPPDTRHEYSNSNYWVLAAALEEASGTDIGVILDQYVIDPMGLTATSLYDATLPDVKVVNAYTDLDLDGEPDAMGTRPLPGLVTPAWTAGAMISNAADLVTFLDGVFGGEIISEASLEEMTDTANGGNGYGLGIYTNSGNWGHDGGIAGYLSAVFHDPRTGVTVAVLTNGFGPDAPQADALTSRLMPAANQLLDE